MFVSDAGSKVVLLNYTKALPKEHLCVHIKPMGLGEVMKQPSLLCKEILDQGTWIQSRIHNTLTTYTCTFLLTFAATTVQTTNSDLEVRHFPADKIS